MENTVSFDQKMIFPWYIREVSVFMDKKENVYFTFSRYGTWRISSKRNKLEIERFNNEEQLRKVSVREIYIDIIRHEVFEPRYHFFVYRLTIDINKYISILLVYDGSSASANVVAVSWSLRKIMRTYKEYVKGLKMRYNWL